MRITDVQLRQIIKEELKRHVDEMAYAGSLGSRPSPEPRKLSYFSGELEGGPNPQGAEKFARSGRFKVLAEKHLANIPYPVWFAPLIGSLPRFNDLNDRGVVMPLFPNGIERLKELGYDVPSEIQEDDVVILYTTMTTDRDFLATPWMIFHAMFDNGPGDRLCNPHDDYMLDPLYSGVSEDDSQNMLSAFTMRSAREGILVTWATADITAELMCQALLTRGGIKFNFDAADPAYHDNLRQLAQNFNREADEFRRNMKGKFFIVAVN